MTTDIILSGVGGQGILSIATVIGAAALREGLFIKQAEVHGMSQRGGDVQSNLRISSEPIASDLIPLGQADLVISLEPMEVLRYLPYLKKDGRLIGNISVEKKADIYRLDGEIGYFLLDEYKGQGIMTEAVSQICELAFSELDICRITGLVFAENTASARVLEKNGFKPEGCMKQAVIKNGMLHDLLVYGKLKTI